ncbi:MAG TPA: hypothetical protein VFI24_14235 [Pyrinomonadaceae bacterium]|nr:hypothetical protein [Pyrinomonadaceae bacterium]
MAPVVASNKTLPDSPLSVGLVYQIRNYEILITSVMDLRRDRARWKDTKRRIVKLFHK